MRSASSLARALPQTAHAQANLTFTGGSGTPLTVTLATPITYTVTQALNDRLIFAFDAVGGGNFGFSSVTGTLSYRINNGAINTIGFLGNGSTLGDITADYLLLYNESTSTILSVNDTVTLTSGTIATNGNIAAARPANVTFTTFLVRSSGGGRVSTNGVATINAVPEPGEWATMGMAGAGLCGLMVRARRQKAAGPTLAA